jgi:hypothetical protein
MIVLFYSVDAANALPSSVLSTLANPALLKGNSGAGSADPKTVHKIIFDTSKADRVFGIKYRTKEECARDMILEFGKRGW